MQGGVGAYTHELAKAFVQQGHQVSILTDQRAQASEPGITVAPHIKSWNRASVFQVRQWALSNHFDVINIQYEAAAFQMAGLVHLLPSRLTGTPIVTTFHDLMVPYLFPKAGPLRYRTLLRLARTSRGVIVTNRQDEAQLWAERGMPAVRYIPIGSNIPDVLPPDYDRAAWRAQLEIPAAGLVIGYFGFLNASKGIDTLLESIAFSGQQGLNVYLLMIGGRTGSSDPSNERYAQSIDQAIERLSLGSRLRWTGFVTDPQVSAHLHACDMIALPYTDGVSFRRGSFMAALSHGCAIITTVPEVTTPELQDGMNVRLIPPRNAPALSAAIRDLADDPTLCQRLQMNARLLAQTFAWNRIAAQSLDFYQELIIEKPQPRHN